MTHIHSVMLYHYGNKFVHKTYSSFNAQFIKKSEIPKTRHDIYIKEYNKYRINSAPTARTAAFVPRTGICSVRKVSGRVCGG